MTETEHKTSQLIAADGTALALHIMGDGRPVVLLHGLFSNAATNWLRFGHAQLLAASGFRVIMPDLRAHGQSEAPHNPAAYPPDILVSDLIGLIGDLGLQDYDLAGFSLGARLAAQAVVAGLAPRRLVLAGMGLEGLAGWAQRSAFFLDAIERFDTVRQGDRAFMAVSFMKTMKIDREAARLLLGSVQDMAEADLARITMPTLVLCGDQDRDNGSPHALVDALPDGHYAEIPGTHMSSVSEPAMGDAMLAFLRD